MKKQIIIFSLLSILSLNCYSQSDNQFNTENDSVQTWTDLIDLNDSILFDPGDSLVDPFLDFPSHDDTDLRGTLEKIFSVSGEIHFMEYIKRLSQREREGRFYLNNNLTNIPDGYYEDLLEYQSTCDSIVPRFPGYNIFGDLKEHYRFYKNGKVDRIISVYFLKGEQLIEWTDNKPDPLLN